MAIILGRKPGGGGGGGAPSGPAGGDLAGTYPNPTIDPTAAVITIAKDGSVGLSGAVTLSEGSGVTLTQSGQDIEIAAAGGGDTELAYTEFTANVTISGTDGAQTDVVSSGALVYAATRICIEFFAVIVEPASGDFISIVLWDDATRLGEMAEVALSTTRDVTVMARRFLTPTAASHTYRIRAFRNASNGTIYAGGGASGQQMPGYIRVTTADSA